ncbi:MAG: DUF2877 domain-containing protein [Firmicutes bacterium]|nr:DUF2877 domain-containing protein [Bacillota bacterium]
MKAVQVCKNIKKNIDGKKIITGEIHSVYSRAFNIVLENNDFITILSSEKSITPNSILLNKKIDFLKLEINQGSKTYISSNSIVIDDIGICIEFNNAKEWDPSPLFSYEKASESEILHKLEILEKLIYKYGKLEGIAPVLSNVGTLNKDYKLFSNTKIEMNEYSIFIIHRLEKFLKYISNNEIDKISDATKQIIGFGPGLTPSMDDLISGLMLSLVYLIDYYDLDNMKTLNINKLIISEVLNKTTRVSEEMLKSSSIGECMKDYRNFIISLLSDSNGEELKEKFINAIKFGDTSGTDTICGIYFGFRTLLNKKNRRLFINGA